MQYDAECLLRTDGCMQRDAECLLRTHHYRSLPITVILYTKLLLWLTYSMSYACIGLNTCEVEI